ncbi:FecR family protein [Bradyrhizobium sp.]|uniref:FecR family protein n=1 Tax=Bradyrhizobium sp. TaxID=376 RepID=UPI002D3FB592|nr:FecR family protein [Bradyrhizobium sp.]HZR77294.1 FecR family protein [Bradyrhizobium sp.]
MHRARNYLYVLVTALALSGASHAFAADGGTWSVSKSSGEVWITNGEVQQASLNPADNLKPGDTIRTGRNGRVLLVRGEESILIAPNSVVGLPTEPKEGLSTTIVQKAGSILLEVEKRNVKHFEVETPYLAAVVKGTQFRVTVGANSTSVDVTRGQVEVTDFKSGQIAQVLPGQKATAFERGKPGLSLSGSGTFNPIEQGKPRPSSVDRVPVPKGGFAAIRNAANGQKGHAGAYNKLRISSALGEVKLDVHKVTRGLARGSNGAGWANRNLANNTTVWSSSQTATANTVSSTTSAAGNSASSTSSTVAATVAAATNAGSSNGNGNAANGNGNNGNGLGLGNGGVGNGNGKGNLKH